jgi:transcriptional regulator with XRE-family HTH domain
MSDLFLENNGVIQKKQSIDAFIGQKLRNFRLRYGVTIADIAKKVNVSMQLIQKYETGLTKIPVSVLCRIADILHINPSDFFEDYNKLTHSTRKPSSLSHVKTNSLNILMVSVSIDIDYMIQNVSLETGLKISTFNLVSSDDIDDYARQLQQMSHKIPMPDIVLYDMPAQKSNLNEVIKKIRLKPFNIEAPIIVLSTNPDTQIMQKAYHFGIAGYIYKNIPVLELQENLKYLLLYWGKSCNLLGTIQ